MARRIRNHIRSNIYGLVAIFLALSGTATASHLAVRSNDIVNGQVKSPDVGTNQIRSADVRDGHLTGGGLQGIDIFDGSLTGGDIADTTVSGADVNEGTLDKVPTARSADMGGTGRYGLGSCDPESFTFVACATLGPISLPAPGRLMVVGTATARPEFGADSMLGDCRIKVDGITQPGTGMDFQDDNGETYSQVEDSSTTVTVTGVLAAGNHNAAVECNQDENDGAIHYSQATIIAVSLSAT